MNKEILSFITYADLKKHINETVIETYLRNLTNCSFEQFTANILDPFKYLFDTKIYQKDLKSWISAEIIRQKDKTNNNSVGYFHQYIFKYIKGCEVPNQGFDVIFTERDGKGIKERYFIELKNKYNTMNSASTQKTYIKFQNWILKNKFGKCVLVEVISKKSYNGEWRVSVDGEIVSNPRILKMSIDQFYKLVTGQDNAFYQLCQVMPMVLDDIISEQNYQCLASNNVDSIVQELKEIDRDAFTAILKITFNNYLGFK